MARRGVKAKAGVRLTQRDALDGNAPYALCNPDACHAEYISCLPRQQTPWRRIPRMIKTDLCIIGANPAGLAVAAGAAALKVPVVLVDNGGFGEQGPVAPEAVAAALSAAGRAADAVRRADRFGIRAREPIVDFDQVIAGVKARVATMAASSSRARFEAMGVKVIARKARFTDKAALEAAGETIRARRFIIATSGRPQRPAIPGLGESPHVTPDSILDLARLPRRLAVMGAGGVALQLAQAFRRLGSLVDVFDIGPALAGWDEELAGIALRALRREGVVPHAPVDIRRIELVPGGLRLTVADAAGETPCDVTHLLVATGTAPALDGLNLEAAGIATTPAGLMVDAAMRCAGNPNIHAVGAAAAVGAGSPHLAQYQAGLVLRHALLRAKGHGAPHAPVLTVFTDPELAWVGPSEAEARAAQGGAINVLRLPFAEADRALADDLGTGLIKVVTSRGGRVLGCGIVGAHAAELIAPWALALSRGLAITDMADLVLPAPGLSELSSRVARLWYLPRLAKPSVSRLLRLTRWWG